MKDKINEAIKKVRKANDDSLKVKIGFSVALALLVGFIHFYFFLPAINVRAVDFWGWLFVIATSASLPFLDLKMNKQSKIKKGPLVNRKVEETHMNFNKWVLIPVCLPLAVIIIGNIISSTFFNARSYASIIEVDEYSFSEDMPESNEITNIALMDTASATVLGNRVLGSLSDMVSQYTVSDYYTQINFCRTPKKVSNLEYDGFFKWLGNRDTGIPGMVMVDPVKAGAEYMAFPEPIHYADSGFFGDDLQRRLRFSFPTKIFYSTSFETDDEGNPYYIVACAKPRVGLFGAQDISEVILFDPVTGEGEIMPVSETPSWVDIVYTGYLACDKYNWQGTLSGGFFNSIIGNVGCKMATDDFGYIVIEDDVWYFTGVTSVVSNDKSNIGFILSNARTGEYKFYPVIGAEEHSAMAAAEGEVQEKGYVSSFPSLINLADQPTYIMVLKDAAGVVKLYALVNVENYSIVATGSTQSEAMLEYKKLLRQSGVGGAVGESEALITVDEVRIVPVGGVSTVYITAITGEVYKGYLDSDEALILVRKNQKINVKYTPTETDGLYYISEWSFYNEGN